MNITLNSEQERLIGEQLLHGHYQSTDEGVGRIDFCHRACLKDGLGR